MQAWSYTCPLETQDHRWIPRPSPLARVHAGLGPYLSTRLGPRCVRETPGTAHGHTTLACGLFLTPLSVLGTKTHAQSQAHSTAPSGSPHPKAH